MGTARTQKRVKLPKDTEGITSITVKTKAGHDLRFFYNRTRGLLVIDLNHSIKAGGHEIVRRVLNEEALLAHCATLPNWEDA
jgi:hypothetical protein